jgi:hypothetical protein
MRKNLLSLLSFVALVLCVTASGYAQGEASAKTGSGTTASGPAAAAPIAITASTTPADLARAAFTAQGGEKFKNLKCLVLIGSVNLYAPNSTQSLPGQFAIVTAPGRLRMEVNAPPIIVFKQIFDGQNFYNSLPNSPNFPNPGKFGLAVLAKFDQAGYTVTALPDVKKQRGFRITDGEGNATDFYLDSATGRVTTYSTIFNGVTFATENRKMKDVEGVLVPYSFTMRLELQAGTAFAEFNVKDVKVNPPVGDDVFAIPN